MSSPSLNSFPRPDSERHALRLTQQHARSRIVTLLTVVPQPLPEGIAVFLRVDPRGLEGEKLAKLRRRRNVREERL